MTPEQELDLRLAEPTTTNSVVHFRIGYPDTPKTYDYAGIRTGNGQWYLTGPDSPQGYRWPQIVGWLKNKNALVHSMFVATDWEGVL